MSFLKSTRTHKTCPITGKAIKPDHKPRFNRSWYWWLMPFSGLAALIWFIIRVIPKPSRATYPCQRVAFPLASSFIIWLLGLAGSTVAYHKAKRAVARARYILAATCIVASVSFIWMAMSADTNTLPDVRADAPLPPNAPIGVAKGVNPGRVAWIHDPNATNWAGGHPPYWWDNTCINQQVVNQMLSKALRALTGENSDSNAWDTIFRSYNQQHGRGDVGYTAGEKIAIKQNWVLMVGTNSGTKSPGRDDWIDNSPQLAIALLNQLTKVAGVSPGDISIGDPMNCMPNYWYDMVYAQCPGVVYLTRSDSVTLYGRTKVSPDDNALFYWSDPITSRTAGKTQDKICTHFSQSTYFINFAILKSHTQNGITVCAKNHYGSLRTPNQAGYYDMHLTRALETPAMGNYRATVDLMCHPKLGGKTALYLVDGLYAGRGWDAQPIKWNMAPFNNDWPSSIFLSQDPVAIDSVAFDFMFNEWTGDPGTYNGYPQRAGTEDYLHEAALIPDPCSGANYDPNHDGSITQSLGVHEHWNNTTDKQYSRNLDPVNGTGIELVNKMGVIGDYDDDGIVNFNDFAVFAAAWKSIPGDANWDPECDISIPSNNNIVINDLDIFCEYWLK